MRKFFCLRSRKRVEMEGIEAQVDCATRIARHKLTVYKNWLPFHSRSCTRISKQPGSATYLVCFRPGSNWGPCACEAHGMTTTLQKLAWGSTSSGRCVIFLFSFSVNKTPNACFCPGSNWGPCARKADVMTVTLHKQAHAYLLTYIKIYLTTLAIHNIFVKIQ